MMRTRVAAAISTLTLLYSPSKAVPPYRSAECNPGEPAARVASFVARTHSGGVALTWATIFEQDTYTFDIGRSPSASGPFQIIGSQIPHTGTSATGSAYQFFDPSGTNRDFYRLGETETTGRWSQSIPIIAVDDTMVASSQGTYEVAAAGANPNYPETPSSVPDALIICPDAWIPTLAPLRDHWNTVRHHVTRLVGLSESGSTVESIHDYIHGTTFSYVLLVGDASEGIIPSWAGIDAPYGDSYSNWDGLSDIALGRWPVHSALEAAACVQKSIEYDAQSLNQDWRRRWVGFINDTESPYADGEYARSAANLLFSQPPEYVSTPQYRVSEICCDAAREQVMVNVLNDGAHLVLLFGTESYQHMLVRFIQDQVIGQCAPEVWSWRLFDMNRIAATSKYTFFLGASCQLGNVDYDWANCVGSGVRPMAEKFLVAPGKGAIAWFGPYTLASHQEDNYGISKEILSRLTFGTTTSVGQVCSEAIRAYAIAHPDALMRLSNYQFLGDPTIVLSWGPTDPNPPTDLAEGMGQANFFTVQPNPTRNSFGIRFRIGRQEDVRIAVYNIGGRRIRLLAPEGLRAGVYDRVWNGRDEQGRVVAAGVYLVQMRTADRVFNHKVVLVR